MSDIKTVVSNDEVNVVGGSLHGKRIEVEFAENVVHVIDNENYQCKTINGERVLAYVNEGVIDYILSRASYINFG